REQGQGTGQPDRTPDRQRQPLRQLHDLTRVSPGTRGLPAFLCRTDVHRRADVRVMGVDPGLTRCGLSVIENGRGRQVTALDVDVVRTPADDPLSRRLLTISDTGEHWRETHLPDVIAIEPAFSTQNASTAMGTAQAGGVIALAAAKRNIDVYFHTPSEVKAAVTGNGRADKAQVTAMVTRILALQTKPTPADAADALALAICHCWRAPMIARMAQAEAMAAEQQRKYKATIKAKAKAAR